jgi:tetratricopeptide (TPR) repeat protein
MSIWNWIRDRERQAEEDNDLMQMEMHRLFHEALDKMDTTPDEALELLHRSRQMAQFRQDAWWFHLVNHWDLQIRLHFKRDLTHTLQMATDITEAVHDVLFMQFPQRICLYEDLVGVYTELDAEGYAKHIQSVLDFMEQQVTPQVECFMCLQDLKARFLIEKGDFVAAVAQTHRYIEASQGVDHHLGYGYITLAELAFRRGEWLRLGEYAQKAESHARAADNQGGLMTALVWQAAAAQHSGNNQNAIQLLEQAFKVREGYAPIPDANYFFALMTLYEIAKQFQQALNVAEQHIRLLIGRSRYTQEKQWRLHVIRLKNQLGQPIEKDLSEARALAAKLKNPLPLLTELSLYETSEKLH